MAKKIDRDEQSKNYLANLLGSQSVTPISSTPSPVRKPKEPEPVQADRSAPGRRRQGEELKTRTSFTITPKQLSALKRIAFIEQRSVSDILSDMIEKCLPAYQAALSEFDKLPDSVKNRITGKN